LYVVEVPVFVDKKWIYTIGKFAWFALGIEVKILFTLPSKEGKKIVT